jgi:hypothetical protein
MIYKGRYTIFDPARIKTYPISERSNKVQLEDLLLPEKALESRYEIREEVRPQLRMLAEALVSCRTRDLPVILFTGAHLIKNGLGLLLVDLVRKDLITCIAGNMATAIHDFELALIGATSEYVPQALEKGQFGMAYEFAYINQAMLVGNAGSLGLGEALGKTICDDQFRDEVFSRVLRPGSPDRFAHPDKSVLATCYEKQIPCTIHAGIGTDVVDQHISFDGGAKGGCSGRDFLIYTHEVEKLAKGGMVLNIGSAVTGPEVFLKAASMTGNVGSVPRQIVTADFDIRPFRRDNITDEASIGYYYRDQKSIVVRVPEAYNGKGYYIEGNQVHTVPAFYQEIMRRM